MFIKDIICSEEIKLVKPNIERDVPVSMKWLKSVYGVETLRLMGNITADDFKPSRQEEASRYRDFLTKEDQLNWMISYKDKIVGTVWVDLILQSTVKPPSVHIMIGDKSIRGRGVGSIVERAVMDFLIEQNFKIIYSRVLTSNKRMLYIAINKLGFEKDGESYTDVDGLIWQNLIFNRT